MTVSPTNSTGSIEVNDDSMSSAHIERAHHRHSSPVKYLAEASTPKNLYDSNREHFECRDERDMSRLSPRVMDIVTPTVYTPKNGNACDATFLSISGMAMSEANSSFRNDVDDDIQIDQRIHGYDEEETEDERLQREIEESEALARQLMEEEAMATYAMSAEYLRDNADQFSSEDLAALQAAMVEEAPISNDEEESFFDNDASNNLSYETLLRLGESIGDVKEERWAMIASEKIQKIPTVLFTQTMAEGKDENHTEVKCLICQFAYEDREVLRRLPCSHYFHKECNDNWMKAKDTCALCRKSIVSGSIFKP